MKTSKLFPHESKNFTIEFGAKKKSTQAWPKETCGDLGEANTVDVLHQGSEQVQTLTHNDENSEHLIENKSSDQINNNLDTKSNDNDQSEGRTATIE